MACSSTYDGPFGIPGWVASGSSSIGSSMTFGGSAQYNPCQQKWVDSLANTATQAEMMQRESKEQFKTMLDMYYGAHNPYLPEVKDMPAKARPSEARPSDPVYGVNWDDPEFWAGKKYDSLSPAKKKYLMQQAQREGFHKAERPVGPEAKMYMREPDGTIHELKGDPVKGGCTNLIAEACCDKKDWVELKIEYNYEITPLDALWRVTNKWLKNTNLAIQ